MRFPATGLLAIGLLAPACAPAAVIAQLETTHVDDRYTLSVDVLLDAERSKVWQIMTDYEHLPRVSHIIVKSHVLKAMDQNRQFVSRTTCWMMWRKLSTGSPSNPWGESRKNWLAIFSI